MTTEDLANADGANTATPATIAAPETEKVDTTAQASEQAATTTEEGAKPDAAQTDAEKDKAATEAAKTLNERKQRAKERVQEAVSRQHEAERRAERAERELAQLRGKMKPPVADEFTDPAKRTAEEVNHALDQRRAAELEATREEAAQEAQHERTYAFRDRVAEFKATMQDPEAFDKAAMTINQYMSPETVEMISEIEDGPALIPQLANDLSRLRQIEKMPARARAFELGKLAAQITAKPLPRVTAAPQPVNAVGGRSSGTTPKFGSMSNEEYAKVVAQEMKR